MIKKLIVSFPEKCIGCELCVLEAQRQLNKVGLDGALIRILRHQGEESKSLEFHINLDPQVNSLDIESIRDICPDGVFTIEEVEQDGLLI